MPVRIGYKWFLSLKSGKQFPVFVPSCFNFEGKLILSISNVIFLINFSSFTLHNQTGLSIKIRNRLVLVFTLSETAAQKPLRKLCWENFIIYSGNTLAKSVW